MLFSNISMLDEEFRLVEHAYVGINGERIDYIGTEPPEKDYGQVYDGRGRLLMAGFFNAHAHTPMTLLRGYGEGLTLSRWLNELIFPFEARLVAEDVYYSTLLGIAESLRYGIISTTDMYYFGESMTRAILDSGVKNNLGLGIVCFGDEDLDELRNYQESVELLHQYPNTDGGRLKIDLSLHAEYTSNEKIARQIGEASLKHGTRLHIHLSETRAEHEACKERHGGLTPAAYFDSVGLFQSPTTAAHCVWLEEGDLDILAARGVSVATCPASNLKLASGVANAPAIRNRGINLALGTDGVSSNNSLNYLADLKLFAMLQKEKWQDPTLISPKEALMIATRNGARAQGRMDTGSLAVGQRADLIVLDLAGPHMSPMHDAANQVVYAASGSDVVLTMVDGRVLYQDGEYPTIDLEQVKYQVNQSKNRILSELAQKGIND